MRLVSAQITNFRSIDDSQQFSMNDLTCLVGKNEAGKTAVLQAIAGLNPHPATPFEYEIERDYPKRSLARYKDLHPDQHALVVTSDWELPESAKAQIKEHFGAPALTGSTVTLSRRYEAKKPHWRVPVIEKEAIKHLVATAGFSAPEKSQVGTQKDSVSLIEKLSELAPNSEKHQALLDQVTGYPNKSITSKVRAICEPYLPRFMYFSNYDRMSATVHLPTLARQAEDKSLFSTDALRGERLFWEFLEFSGVSLGEILGATTFESFNAKLIAASNTLTEEILQYWTQNQDIEVRVNVAEGKSADQPPFNSGAVGRARIYNMLHKSDTSFSERSAGFTWFFSFLIKFNRVKKDGGGPTFLLLDEPGLTLHGMAQADLLRYFNEKLSPHHQIIYSTHSPFMVPPDDLSASRIVEDIVRVDQRGRRTPTGTRVRTDILSTDRDSVFPLQGALGYSLTQTLFIGKHTILVEGPSDILYLKALSAELNRRNRPALDPAWVLCPSGGLDKIQAFVSLFAGNELDVIALTDFSKKEQRKIETLKRMQVLKAGGLLTINDYCNADEADIEDLFEPELFVSIVNSAYDLHEPHIITAESLDAADASTTRLVKKAEAYFRLLPETVPTFDHFTPAAWLIEHVSTLSGDASGVTETLDRAERLFSALNDLKGKT